MKKVSQIIFLVGFFVLNQISLAGQVLSEFPLESDRIPDLIELDSGFVCISNSYLENSNGSWLTIDKFGWKREKIWTKKIEIPSSYRYHMARGGKSGKFFGIVKVQSFLNGKRVWTINCYSKDGNNQWEFVLTGYHCWFHDISIFENGAAHIGYSEDGVWKLICLDKMGSIESQSILGKQPQKNQNLKLAPLANQRSLLAYYSNFNSNESVPNNCVIDYYVTIGIVQSNCSFDGLLNLENYPYDSVFQIWTLFPALISGETTLLLGNGKYQPQPQIQIYCSEPYDTILFSENQQMPQYDNYLFSEYLFSEDGNWRVRTETNFPLRFVNFRKFSHSVFVYEGENDKSIHFLDLIGNIHRRLDLGGGLALKNFYMGRFYTLAVVEINKSSQMKILFIKNPI